MKRFILYVSLLGVSVIWGQAKKYTQQEIDSFVKTELTLDNLDKFKKILNSNEGLTGWTTYYAILCNDFRSKGQNDSSIFYGNKAIDSYTNTKIKNPLDEESLMGVYFSLGVIDFVENKFETSIIYLQKALDIEKKYPYKYKSYIRAYIAGNHFRMGDNNKALGYYHENLKDTVYAAIPQPYVVTLTRIATLYTENYLNVRDSALYYFKKAIRESHSTTYKDNLPIIYGTLADLYQETNKDSVLHYYRMSKKSFENYTYEKNISPDNLNYFQITNNSYVNIFDGKADSAITDLTKVIDSLSIETKNKDDKDILLKAFDYLVMAYESKKNYKKANSVLKRKNGFNETFHKQELEQGLSKLELEYETEKKEDEIQELKAQAESKNTITRQQRILLLGGIGSLSLLLIIAGLTYRQNNLKNKYEKVSLQQRLLRSQMNPHFLFNALNTAQLLVSKKSREAEKYITNLAKLLRLALENSRENFVPILDELNALESYLNLQSNFLKKFDFNIEIDESIDAESIQIPPMLLQPIIENAIIHGITNISYRGIIDVKINKEDSETLTCTITDNGEGLTKELKKLKPNRKHKSISIDIVRERLAIYHKKTKKTSFLVMNSNSQLKNGKVGTQVKLFIPFLRH